MLTSHWAPCSALRYDDSSAALRAALQSPVRGVADIHRCIAALNASRPPTESFGPEYFEYVPLMHTRLLQMHAHALAAEPNLGAIFGHLGNASASLESLSARASAKAARTPAQRQTIARAFAGYSLCARSGRYDAATGGRHPAIHRLTPRPDATLHLHHHVTNHAGTTMGGMYEANTCALGAEGCGRNIDCRLVHGCNESGLLGATATFTNAVAHTPGENYHGCCGSMFKLPTFLPEYCDHDGDALLDIGAFEPNLPQSVPLDSPQIIWSSIARHPMVFAVTNAPNLGDGPELLLQSWLGGGSTTRVSGYSDKCFFPKMSLQKGPYTRWKCDQERSSFSGAPGGGERLCKYVQSTEAQCKGKPRGADAAEIQVHADLEVAKERARHFGLLMILEDFSESAKALCIRLGWPRCSTHKEELAVFRKEREKLAAAGAIQGDRIDAESLWMAESRKEIEELRDALAVAQGASRQGHGRTLNDAPVSAHHDVSDFLRGYGWGLHEWAELSLVCGRASELYFFIRELNRVDHREMGLRPPPTNFLDEPQMKQLARMRSDSGPGL